MSPHAAPPQAFRFAQLSSGARIAWTRTGAPTAPTLVRVAHWLTNVEYDLHSPLWRPWVERRRPTLVVHGELDVFYRIEHMRYMQSLVPDSELVVMQGTGHLPTLTRPLEVAAHIERFFAARGL